MNSILPAVIGVFATLVAIFLLIADKNDKVTARSINLLRLFHLGQDASARLFTTIKGFLLMFCLAVLFATLVYYFG